MHFLQRPADFGDSLADVLPMDVVMRVRHILMHIQNRDIVNLRPGYWQEVTTLAHLIMRRSQVGSVA